MPEQVSKWKVAIELLKSRYFYKQLLWYLASLILLYLILIIFLRSYTHHGEKLSLPDYIGADLQEASRDAADRSFEIVVNDSVHIVGKKPGEILSQDPTPLSQVKEGRKIYVTTAKHLPDVFEMSQIPVLYGKNYENKKEELLAGFELKSKVIGYRYDPGPKDHILEVRYNGETIVSEAGRNTRVKIEKGSTLEYILSQSTGGEVPIPKLVCMPLAEARFLVEHSLLKVENVIQSDLVEDEESAYVVQQVPPYQADRTMVMGEGLTLYISANKPDECP